MPTALQLQPRSASTRCVLCHDDLEEVAVTCPDCGTLVHEECQLDRCPTLGCASENPWEWVRLPSEPWAERSPWRQPLILLNVILLGLIVFGLSAEWALAACVGSSSRTLSFMDPESHPSVLDPKPPCYCGEHAMLGRVRFSGISGRACGGRSRTGRLFSYRQVANELRCDPPDCGCKVTRVWALRRGKAEESYEAFGNNTSRVFWSGDSWVREIREEVGGCVVSRSVHETGTQRVETPAGIFDCTYEHTSTGKGEARIDLETWTAAGIPLPVVTQVTWRTPGAPGGFPNVRRSVLRRIAPPPNAR